jgi:hypothetical protein
LSSQEIATNSVFADLIKGILQETNLEGGSYSAMLCSSNKTFKDSATMSIGTTVEEKFEEICNGVRDATRNGNVSQFVAALFNCL